jgi:hypothetical protein
METFAEIKKCWQENTSQKSGADLLSKASVATVIRQRVKKEKNKVMQYFWASFTYQVLIYAFASHLVIKFWDDRQIMLLAVCGALLYIPFTIVLLKKFKAMNTQIAVKLDYSAQNIRDNVKNQYLLLSEFFRFKKRFEWLAIPLSCFIMVMIVFKLYVPGGMEDHLTGGIISFLALLACFVTAIYFENRKRFIEPLRQLELVLEDIDKN